MTKRVAYVSGPMTGMPDLNFPAFHAAAAGLRASGWEVVNPAEFDEADGPVELTWEDYLRRDIKALVDCTHIALLPGWEKSRGARLEKRIADDLGMRPIFLMHNSQPVHQQVLRKIDAVEREVTSHWHQELAEIEQQAAQELDAMRAKAAPAPRRSWWQSLWRKVGA